MSVEARPEPRSAGALRSRRVQQDWPANREFRILSIDGGGIRGIFPAVVLAELEERFLGTGSISAHFDLVTGTSTGGIIALALGLGIHPREIARLYIERGQEIFPPYPNTLHGRWAHLVDWFRKWAFYRYDRTALEKLLGEFFGDHKLGDSKLRLCIPSAEGRHGDVYIFKTPHHPDYKKDLNESMVNVACATAAAPTYFRPHDANGYRFLDGGVWANNPIMVGLVDALACYNVERHAVRILSLGCGEDAYTVSDLKTKFGGLVAWHDIMYAAMKFQSQNAMGQAGLLVGAERIERISPDVRPPILLDDWARAVAELPSLAVKVVRARGVEIASTFFTARATFSGEHSE